MQQFDPELTENEALEVRVRFFDNIVILNQKMSGIWTKQMTVDNRSYYYNAALNRSVWEPPPSDLSNVHVAPNLKAPTYLDLAGASSSYGTSSSSSSSIPSIHQEPVQPPPQSSFSYNQPITSSSTTSSSATTTTMGGFVSADELMRSALQKQKQQQQQQGPTKSEANTTSNVSSGVASYLQQKASLEAAAGAKNDHDNSNWNVR